MPNFFSFASSQDVAGMQQIPMLFRWLDEAGVGQANRAGQWTPFTAGPDGALIVRVATVGPDTLSLEPDNADIAPSAANTVVPVNARNYTRDPASGNWRRVEQDDDSDDRQLAVGRPNFFTMGRNRLYLDQPDEWVRERGNSTPFPVLAPLASRTATTTFDFLENPQHKFAHFVINVTAIGADTLTVAINAFDPAGFVATYPLLTSPVINATGVTVLKIGPGFTPVANLTANDVVPFDFQVVATHSGPIAITYSIGVQWVK